MKKSHQLDIRYETLDLRAASHIIISISSLLLFFIRFAVCFAFLMSICLTSQVCSAQAQQFKTADVSNKDELVNTPGGPIKKSNVHQVEKGCYLSKENGRIKKINTKTGKVVEEYDIPKTNPTEQNLRTPKKKALTQIDSTFGTGWVTYADWTNNSGSPISYFNTNWIVPNPPTTFNNQTIFLFNGIDPPNTGDGILQPVLQWGISAAGGGNYWAITNWYVEGSGTAFWGTSLITVSPGANLQGVMRLTASTDSGYSYNSAFIGDTSCDLQINNIAELTWANETMEIYGITAYTDYPPDTAVRMTNIQILTGTVTPTLSWTPEDVVTDVGQHTIVVSNNSTHGEVDLYFHNPPLRKVNAGIPTAVLTPVTNNCNDTIILSMTLENYGVHTLTTCSVNYILDSNPAVTQTWNGSLTTGQTAPVSFPTFITTVGSHTLMCYSSNPNDSADMQTSNDTARIYFNIVASGALPIVEGFETSTCPSGVLPNVNWNISHTSTSGVDFQITSTASASGSESCMLNNLANVAGDTSVLETNAVYDLEGIVPAPVLTFEAAYQKRASTNADKLQVLTSTDCGVTWQSRKVITATTLASLAGGVSSSPYMPTPAQFTTYTVGISAVVGSKNVMFKWEFFADPAGPGNNLYIDNINLISSTAAGIEQITNSTDIALYPNPTNGIVNIELGMPNENSTLTMTDMLGNTVKQIKVQNLQFTMDVSDLAEGIYNIQIQNSQFTSNKRLVIVR
jgi:type IX secretion system substrate protein